jgi:two-component system, sensor histidine kinase PdtaS
MTDYKKMKNKLQIAEKKIRILEDMVENNSRELFFYNQELQLKNTEKDILLKEIHHRVKNNLQIITSLLAMQSSYIDDDDLKLIYQDSQLRINSMALVHEMLYQTDNISKINFRTYIIQLTESIMKSLNNSGSEIVNKVDVPEVFLNLDTAISLGLIINEIITNSIKHGIEKGKQCSIYTRLCNVEGNRFELYLGDDGKGYEKDIKDISSKSLGLRLIINLSKQLMGEIKKDHSQKGTHYIIKFEEINQTVL